MRLSWLTASALVFVTALAGCSGASQPDVLGSSGGGAATASSSGGTSSGATSSGATSSGGTSTSGGPADAGADGGACPAETEPNDSKGTANSLAPTRCGTIQTVGDTDFLTFALQSTTKSMTLNYTGAVTLTVTVSGANTVILGGGGNQNVPFVLGKPYYVQVLPTDQKASGVAWRVDLVEH